MKTPNQIVSQMYKSALAIMITLLFAAGAASFFDYKVGGIELSAIAIRYYVLVIPAMLMAFTVTMFVRRVTVLAIGGLILSILWLAFKWMG